MRLLFLSLLFLLCTATLGAQTIVIHRLLNTTDCVMGYLFVNGEAIGYTLELPYEGNLPSMSSIPDGDYLGFVRTDGSKGFRLQLDNVPGRTFIQIHLGQYLRHTQGCTLLGLLASPDNCTLGDTRSAMKNLNVAITPYLDQQLIVRYTSE